MSRSGRAFPTAVALYRIEAPDSIAVMSVCRGGPAMSPDDRSRDGARHAMRNFLRRPAVNAILRTSLRPFARWLPVRALCRLPVVGEVTASLPSGARLRLGSDGRDLIASALYWRGLAGYEPETFAVLWKVAADVAVLFDVGASTGVFTLAAALEDRTRRVFAFEPGPGMSADLERNIALNRLTNVTPVAAAACDHDGTVDLFVPPGGSLAFGASTLPSFRPGGVRRSVRAVRLDTFVQQEGIECVDLIKLDAEGAEPAVLAGARALLERDEPWIICEVLHGLTEASLHAELDRLGYRYFAITPRGLEPRSRIVGDSTYRAPNWLFATERRLGACPLV